MKTKLTIAAAMLAAMPVFAQVKYTGTFYMPEFSGCFSRPAADGETFWVCADERQPTDPKDVIRNIRFSDGVVLSNRVMVVTNAADAGMNDMEGMTVTQNGRYFVLTSQSSTSGLEEKLNRRRLAHFHADGALDDFRDDLRASLTNHTPFRFLANYWAMAPKFGGIDIEGIAYEAAANRLWLGFRGPLVNATNPANPGAHAVLVTMTNVLNGSGLFNVNTFGWQTHLILDLGGDGIRDLYWDADTTNLFILSGKLAGQQVIHDGHGNTYTNRQSCHLLAYKPSTSNLTYCMRLPQVPTTPTPNGDTCEAEGICAITLDSVKKLLVTYDSKTHGVYQVFDFPDPSMFAAPEAREGFFGQ